MQSVNKYLWFAADVHVVCACLNAGFHNWLSIEPVRSTAVDDDLALSCHLLQGLLVLDISNDYRNVFCVKNKGKNLDALHNLKKNRM